MKTLLRKLAAHPRLAIVYAFRKVYSLLTWLPNQIFLGPVGLGTFVHPLASIRPDKTLRFGRGCEVNRNVVIWCESVTMGDFVQLNPGVTLYGNVSIGNHVMVAPHVMVAGGNHLFCRRDIPMRFQGSSSRGIIVEDDVWIGANSVITDGVTLARGTIIGAGSVVTKSTEAYGVYVGNPARFVKERPET